MSAPPRRESKAQLLPDSAKHVAVIAVHGVGSPPRDSTAQSVAELLVRYQPNEANYTGFRTESLTLPVAPPIVDEYAVEEKEPSRLKRLGNLFTQAADDRTEFKAWTTSPAVAHAGADIAFMHEQLRGYESKAEPYDTVRLGGERVARDGSRLGVDVYEMYWADLSRVGSGVWRILGAVYQLILHLSQLGRKTLDVADEGATNNPELKRAWSRYASAHARAVRVFTLLIPLATILMLAPLVMFIPAGVNPRWRLTAGIALVALMSIAMIGRFLFLHSASSRAATWFVLDLGLVAGLSWLAYRYPPFGADAFGTALLAAGCAAIVLGTYERFIRSYERGRPGAVVWGRTSLITVIVLTAMSRSLASPGDLAETIRQYAMLAVQWSYLIVMVCWLLLFFFVASSWVLRLRVSALTKSKAERQRLLRATWTARISLAASVGFFIISALVAYQSLLLLALRYQSTLDLFPRGPIYPVVSWLIDEPSLDAQRFFQHMIADSGTSALALVLGGLLLSMLLISWLVVLIAATSIRVPPPNWKHGQQLGAWITDGFRWIRYAGNVFALSVLGFIVIGGIVDGARKCCNAYPPAWLNQLFQHDTTAAIIGKLAFILLASAVTVAAARLRLAMITARARPALGIMLDVDNYLRETPDERTPRAQMAERFVSLLRYVNGLTRANGTQLYDRIVIVSHSQGTVLTADLLRFVKAEGSDDVTITALRHRLLTMGSPLRQLYASNFPHLYRWVDSTDDERATPPDASEFAKLSPFPDEMDVGKWVNLYTSGDYVGRALWRWDTTPGVWRPETAAEAPDMARRRERCLGAGTHTRYWYSAEVAEELDFLIADLAPPVAATKAKLPGVSSKPVRATG